MSESEERKEVSVSKFLTDTKHLPRERLQLCIFQAPVYGKCQASSFKGVIISSHCTFEIFVVKYNNVSWDLLSGLMYCLSPPACLSLCDCSSTFQAF